MIDRESRHLLRISGLFQLTQPTGNLYKITGLEEAKGKADAAIAPASHEKEAAKKEDQATPVGGDQAVFKTLMGLPIGVVVELMMMAEEALGFPGGIVVMLTHVAVDAAKITVVDSRADQTNGATH